MLADRPARLVLGKDKIPHSLRFLLALSMTEWYFVSFRFAGLESSIETFIEPVLRGML